MNEPNYLNPKTPKEKSKAQEKRIAKKGFVTPGSGAFWPYKGDVIQGKYLIEAKRTDKKSMAVKEEWLEKIFREAIQSGKEPGIELDFTTFYIQGVVYRK